MDAKQLRDFKRIVRQHYRRYGRHLPWRETTDPYQILVSEIMLQQTQVDRVIPKYELFITQFPTPEVLAQAPLREVLKVWQGLGYNRRGLALKKTAEMITATYGGRVPQSAAELLELPGIGPYTAGAVATFAYNQPHVIIETNIRTVFLHHFFIDAAQIDDKELLPLIESTLDRKNPREWYWALMDYGSFLKKLHPNPSRRSASYRRQDAFKNSQRQVRGQILKVLTAHSPIPIQTLFTHVPFATERVQEAVLALEKEGLLRLRGKKVWLG